MTGNNLTNAEPWLDTASRDRETAEAGDQAPAEGQDEA